MRFLDKFDKDIRKILIAQLRNLWTHTSTAIEGNTLTLGETAFVIEEGLTVSGKSLKDHQEMVGHARAIDLIYDLVRERQKSVRTIFSIFTERFRLKPFLTFAGLWADGRSNPTGHP